MSEERENNPTLKLKDIKLFENLKLKLDCATPIATGESVYGEWNLWAGFVENATVWNGKGNAATKEEGYTGKVIFFPSTKLNENLIATANGNRDVEITVQKTATEGPKGLITRYEVEKLSEGVASAGGQSMDITPTETKLINDAKDLLGKGYNMTEQSFMDASQQPMYNGQISKERAQQLFELVAK